MVAFSYASPIDRLKTQQSELEKLALQEKQNEFFASRAQRELTNPNISPERRAEMEKLLRDVELNREDIAANRTAMQTQLDDISREVEVKTTEKIAAASAVNNNNLESQPLSQTEQETLARSSEPQSDQSQTRSVNPVFDQPYTEDRGSGKTETGQWQLDVSGSNSANTDDTNATKNSTPVVIEGSGVGKSPLDNPLEKYANYTYGISLHYMPIDKYNQVIADGAEYTLTDNTVLIASGGRRNGSFSRHPKFQNDFYIDDFKMTTVVGFNSRSRGSNAIDISFTIYETYGMTLIERLLAIATQAGIKAWTEMPLVLEIDFFANSDDGQSLGLIRNQRKLICVKLLDCKIKIDKAGSEYAITCMPYNHQALLQNTVTIPANFEVSAKTVGEFFDNAAKAGEAATVVSELSNTQRTAEEVLNESEAERKRLGIRSNPRATRVFKTGSLPAALNSYQEQLASKDSKKAARQQYADVYKFQLDPEIAKSLLVDNKTVTTNTVPMTNRTTPSTTVDVNQGLIKINAGTTLIDVINQVLRNSQYFTDNLKKDSSNKNTNQSIDFWKVVPSIRLNKNKWDNIRKCFQREITFHIKKYKAYNTKSPVAPIGLPTFIAKEYNYIYTGKNQQVIDFKIDFDAMFYLSITDNAKKFGETLVQPAEDDTVEELSSENELGQMQFRRYQPKVNQTQLTTNQPNTENAENVAANDLYSNIFHSSRGDMVNVRLLIAGDPQLIKQDDVFYPPNESYRNQILNQFDSINMDFGEVHVFLVFKTAEDLNQETGMIDFGPRKKNLFDGLYKIITVENSFSRGQFTQTLELVRLFNQPKDRPASPSQQSERNQPESTTVAQQFRNIFEQSEFLSANGADVIQTIKGTTDSAFAAIPELPQLPGIDNLVTDTERLRLLSLEGARGIESGDIANAGGSAE